MKNIFVSILMMVICANMLFAQEKMQKDTQLILTEQLYFDFGKDDIRANEAPKLDAIVAATPQGGKGFIRIIGHTDSIGDVADNNDLSRRRVDAVIQYLVRQRIPPHFPFYSQYKGEYAPIADNASDDGRQQNRRVEIEVYQFTSPPVVEEQKEKPLPPPPVKIEKRKPTTALKLTIKDEETGELVPAEVIYKRYASDTPKSANSKSEEWTAEVTILFPAAKESMVVSFSVYAKGYFHNSGLVKVPVGTTKTKEVLLKPIKKGTKLALKNLYFYGNQARLLPRSIPEIKRLKESLLLNPNVVIEIGGHINYPNTPPSKVPQWSVRLSERRAEVVYKYLVDSGVDPSRLRYKGYSNKEMVYPKATEEREMVFNRRVEVKVLEVLEEEK